MLMKEKFHEGKKQNLSKALVRFELFFFVCLFVFQVGILQQFLGLISPAKILSRDLSRGKEVKNMHKIVYK